MIQNPLVSIIIPTFKRPRMLIRAIKSALNQTYKNIEIIVIDDNEPKSIYRKQTEQLLNGFINKNKVRYIKHNNNKGGAVARNTGIINANGELIAFLDDDDEYMPLKIELQVQEIIKSNVSIVTCFCESYDENGNIIKIYNNIYSGIPLYEHMINNIAGNSLILVRKSDLIKVGNFEDVPSKQDNVLILKILGMGLNISTVKKVLVKYNEHHNERISGINKRKIKGEKIAHIYQKKYFYKLSKNQQKQVVINYLNKMFKYHLYLYGRRKSLKYYFKLLSMNPFLKINLLNTIKLLLNYYKNFRRQNK